MRTFRQKIDNFRLEYPLEKIAPLEQILFIDIETTGLTANSSSLYLIGCIFYQDADFYLIQWFASNYSEELDVLKAFFNFSKKYNYLIHFNGNNFDLPYMLHKCEHYHLDMNFDSFTGIDIYRRISPYKYFLRLPNCKQKTIEQFLGIDREDKFSGGDLIAVYHAYVKEPSEFTLQALLLHNADDMRGMLMILPILSYYDLFNEKIKVKKVQANFYKDLGGEEKTELLMNLSFPCDLPMPIRFSSNECYFRGEGHTGAFRIPIYQEEMKYFYANYKDYYYLPEEDLAIHKSVASFVDKEHRLKATAATCYTRKSAAYLPQWDILFQPFFKREYKSKDMFFELTEEFKQNREAFSEYANHVLHMLASCF